MKQITVAVICLLTLSFSQIVQSISQSGLLQPGNVSLPTGDDEIATIRLTSPFVFYGTSYINLYVSTNGAIALGNRATTLVNIQFPLPSMDEPLIAPFLADADTRGVGTVYYRTSSLSSDLAFANQIIASAYPSFSASQVVVVTWDSVGYYMRNSDKNNTFQCILAWNDQFYFAIFLYVEDLAWTTGDINGGRNGLGGNEAQAGFNSGDGARFFSLPGSQTQGVLDLDTNSNVQVPGVWVFRVDGNITNTTVVDCGSLEFNSNGTLDVTSSLFNSMAVYSCNSGFTLIGSAVRICQENGTWSNDEPTCTVTDCGEPNLPADTTGLVMPVNRTSTGLNGTATYTCASGYVLSGTDTSVCQSDSTWSGVAPSCDLVICGKGMLIPSDTTALVINAPRVTFDSNATYTCSPGYLLNGDSTRICQANGDWSSTPPQCNPVDCGAPPNISGIPNLRSNNSMTIFNSVVNYYCETGYQLNGSDTITCLASGQWSGSPPMCQVADCGALTNVSFGMVSINSTVVNGTAVYSCQEGYELNANANRTCQSNGLWSGVEPMCQLVNCGMPPTRGDITASYTSTLFGSTATYSCSQIGFVFNENVTNTAQCLSSREWSSIEAITCRLVDCGEPEPSNFTMDTDIDVMFSSTTFNATAMYTCLEEGMIVVGEDVRICGADGNWTGISPLTCELVDCNAPDLPSSGFGGLEVDFENTTFNSSAFYNCSDEDLTLVGEDTRICQADGTWSGEPPFCRRRTDLFLIGLSVGVTIGAVLLLLLLLLLLLICCYCCCGRKKSSESKPVKKKQSVIEAGYTVENDYASGDIELRVSEKTKSTPEEAVVPDTKRESFFTYTAKAETPPPPIPPKETAPLGNIEPKAFVPPPTWPPREHQEEKIFVDTPQAIDPFEGAEDIDSVHDFKLYYLRDDISIGSDKQHMII